MIEDKKKTFLYILDSSGRKNEVSLQPPHLIDSEGDLAPAAFIPFCAYETNMTLLGEQRAELPFPVCSHFQPTVLSGQLCYSLDLKSFTKSMPEKNSGLMIILDQGGTLDDSQDIATPSLDNDFDSINLKISVSHESSAKIYLNTLASFTDYREGSYAMNALKKMTGTTSFLLQTDEQKNCRIETYEDCQAKVFIAKVLKNCGCVPWALGRALDQQVYEFIN